MRVSVCVRQNGRERARASLGEGIHLENMLLNFVCVFVSTAHRQIQHLHVFNVYFVNVCVSVCTRARVHSALCVVVHNLH